MELRTLILVAAFAAAGTAPHGQVVVVRDGDNTALDRSSPEHVTYFSGKVTLEDGTPAPGAVHLLRVCHGLALDQGWTDVKGRFWFKVGRGDRGAGLGDATEAPGRAVNPDRPIGFADSNPITNELADCELEAALDGYRADRVSLAVASVGAKNLGVMVLHPVSRAGALTVSATTLLAPADARKAYDRGLEALRGKKWRVAAGDFGKAVQEYPKFAAAWFGLGQARLGAGDVPGAVEAWRQSAKADPRFVRPWENLTVIADQRQDWAESAKASDAWLALDADDFPAAWLYNAIAKAQLGRAGEAEHAAREGLKADKEQHVPRLSYVLGLILMAKREFAESAECFRTYLKLAPDARDAAAVRAQVAEFEKLTARAQ